MACWATLEMKYVDLRGQIPTIHRLRGQNTTARYNAWDAVGALSDTSYLWVACRNTEGKQAECMG